MTSENVLSADNQQERLQLPNPWYVTGITDGEGSFHIALYQDKRMRMALKVIPEFHVSQNATSRQMLEELRQFFNCGNIKINHRGRQSDQTLVLVVRNRDDLLTKIIPFFQKYQLRTTKKKDFEIFSQIVLMMSQKEHQNQVGAKKIINLAYQMNNQGKRRKTNKFDLIKIVESSETICESPAARRDKI